MASKGPLGLCTHFAPPIQKRVTSPACASLSPHATMLVDTLFGYALWVWPVPADAMTRRNISITQLPPLTVSVESPKVLRHRVAGAQSWSGWAPTFA